MKQLSPSCSHSNGILPSYAHVKFCTGEHELKMKGEDMALNSTKKNVSHKKKILFWFTKSYILFLNILRIPFSGAQLCLEFTLLPWSKYCDCRHAIVSPGVVY